MRGRSVTEDAITPAKDRIDDSWIVTERSRLASIERYKKGLETQAKNLAERRANFIGDRYIEEDAKRAGFEYHAPKAPD